MTLPPPPAGQIVRYRYHFTDFVSGRLLATLPLTGVGFTDLLKGVGEAGATLPLTAPEVRAQDVGSATIPRRTCLWAERQVMDGRTVASATVPWAGIIMGRTRSRSGRTAALKAVSWEGYLAKRLVRSAGWKQADKYTVAAWILTNAYGPDLLAGTQYDPDSPWAGVAPYPTAPIWNQTGSVAANYATAGHLAGIPFGTSGSLIDRTYIDTDLRTALDALTSLGNTGTGLDWHLTPYRDATTGQLAVRADLGYPRLGRTAPPGIQWDDDAASSRRRSGYLNDYQIAEDESDTTNRYWALGPGQPPDQIRARVTNTAEGLGGYPQYEGALTDSATDDLVTVASVTAHAQGAMDAGRLAAVQVSGIKVRGDLTPTLDTYVVGDDATLNLSDVLTGERITVIGQITGRKVTPPEQGTTEQVELVVQGSVT